jgi:hypothetical protein
LPTVAFVTGLTKNFFSATALCRAPELEALGYAESSVYEIFFVDGLEAGPSAKSGVFIF